MRPGSDIGMRDDPDDTDILTGEGPPPVPTKPQEDAGPRRRGFDDTVLAVLREEAEREAAVRRAETPPPMEVQTDLGLAPSPLPPALPPSVLAARERFSDLSVSPVELPSGNDMAARPASRRELLPDIEGINSTLRASSVPRGDDTEEEAETNLEADRRGFRTGLILVFLIAVLLWSAYVVAPRIMAAVPASKPAMQAYVDGVDRARLSVDAALQSAIRSLRSLSGLDGEGG